MDCTGNVLRGTLRCVGQSSHIPFAGEGCRRSWCRSGVTRPVRPVQLSESLARRHSWRTRTNGRCRGLHHPSRPETSRPAPPRNDCNHHAAELKGRGIRRRFPLRKPTDCSPDWSLLSWLRLRPRLRLRLRPTRSRTSLLTWRRTWKRLLFASFACSCGTDLQHTTPVRRLAAQRWRRTR